jgi:hypothetical protein
MANPTDRILAVLEGQELDRVQTFAYLTDKGPAYQIIGFPKITDAQVMKSWIGRLMTSRFGMGRLCRAFMATEVKTLMFTCVEAAAALGFDSVAAAYAPSFSRFVDGHTLTIGVDKVGHFARRVVRGNPQAPSRWRERGHVDHPPFNYLNPTDCCRK